MTPIYETETKSWTWRMDMWLPMGRQLGLVDIRSYIGDGYTARSVAQGTIFNIL